MIVLCLLCALYWANHLVEPVCLSVTLTFLILAGEDHVINRFVII